MSGGRRDPFPMSSPEAMRMVESVQQQGIDDGSGPSSQWNSMSTQSLETMRSGNANESGDGRGGTRSQPGSQQRLIQSKKVGGTASDQLDRNSNNNSLDDDMYQTDADPAEEDEDDFLDRPLWELRSKTGWIWRRAEKLYHVLYGDKLPPAEMLRTLCLGSTLFLVMAVYWTMRSLKDPILTALCGVSVIPKAKILSVPVELAIVSIYNHFLDSDMPRHQLFYLIGTVYTCVFFGISLLLMHPTIGLDNQMPSPYRTLGWVSYCAIESFGSVMVSLFWSFTNSNFNMETAQASYGVMVAVAQVGSILGPTFVNQSAQSIGVAACYMIGSLVLLLLQGTMRLYIHMYGVAERNAVTVTPKSKPKAGILEGLHLFWKYHYVKRIFAISCLFMVEVTIVDFTMKLLAKEYLAEQHPCQMGESCWSSDGNHGMSEDATTAFTTFMGFFGQATNTLSFLMSLLGTSAVIRFLGLRWTLLLFPILCLCVIIFVRLEPTLYTTFAAMIILKASSYALNNPTKEMLYQVTSSAIRYKAKSWIDIFGSRGSKALGSLVTNAFSDSARHLVANGSLVGMAVASFLIWNAYVMGATVEEYMATGYIVGEENDILHHHEKLASDEIGGVELSGTRGPGDDDHDDDEGGTSCAVYVDDHEIGREEEGQSLPESVQSSGASPANVPQDAPAEVQRV